jgi:hypothetical protein
MTDFVKGQKVICIDDSRLNFINKGSIYEVSNVSKHTLRFKGVSSWYSYC